MKYDIIIIGSGPGGYVGAIRAAQLGKRVAIIERSEIGGVCLNWGCIPTKALLKSAQVFHYVRSAASYGIDLDTPAQANMEHMVERSRSVAEMMSKGVAFLLKNNNIEVIAGHASLRGNGMVNILHADSTESEITADHIILATGARPRHMPFIPVDGQHVIDSRGALTLTKLPESMIVVGSGAIGSEFAYFYASIGVKVTLIEYLPNLMPLEDEDVSKQMERSMRKLKIGVMVSTTVHSVRVEAEKCIVEIEGKKGAETLTADVVLSAVGIKSNIENIGLEQVGITVERDKIMVDTYGETSIKGIYAIGDIVASPALAHVASAEAICCVEKICGLDPTPIDYSTIPSCVYTSPEVASVGLTQKQALDQGLDVRVGKFPFTASGKATATGERDGFVKLIFDKSTDILIGAHMVGANVTEMIAEPTLSKVLGATAHQLATTIHPHPTMSEAIMEAAEAAHQKSIHII